MFASLYFWKIYFKKLNLPCAKEILGVGEEGVSYIKGNMNLIIGHLGSSNRHLDVIMDLLGRFVLY